MIKSSSVTKEPAKVPFKFPCILRSTANLDLIILATGKNALDDDCMTGVVIAGNTRPIGAYSNGWLVRIFELYHGSVTITQD